MTRHKSSQVGFSLVEVLVAMGVMTVGALGMAGVFVQGMKSAISAPNELIATQKAAEAVESVFSARDSHTITWAKLRNTAQSGVFLGGARALNKPGNDGIVNTGDSGETLEDPDLSRYTREIRIADLSDDLRAITVIIVYPSGSGTRTYTLTSYISSYA